jgi:histidyl-tRNA synthetase
MTKKKGSLSTDPYKGVRDFYPEDMYVQGYIFETMKDVVEHFGFEEYTTSILEPSELYIDKTSEEIVKEQTYSFIDRGKRNVTLRPEMTPSVARLVAGRRRDLSFPLRWYTIANVFRYEKPQRGRLREHFQLNCDLFGVSSIEADVEIVLLSYELMRAFGASDGDFEIRINNRAVIPETLSLLAKQNGLELPEEKQSELLRLMDKKEKMDKKKYGEAVKKLLGANLSKVVLENYKPATIRKLIQESEAGKTLLNLLEKLESRGITNIVHDPYLVRGFDYYTGMIFEVFDTSSENNRSLFGGGRYDDLLDMFGEETVPTVGFGMGDVTLKDFLEIHHLIPRYVSPTDLYVVPMSPSYFDFAAKLGQKLRRHDLSVAVDYSGKKMSDQIKTATKKKVPFVIVVGEEEEKSGMYKLKHLDSKRETEVTEGQIADIIFQTLE